MQRKEWKWNWILMIAAVAALVITGCAAKGLTPETAPEVFPCVVEGEVQKEIALEAELTEFSCGFRKWGGADTLHFKVAVKNVSQKPQRYRVNIFLDNAAIFFKAVFLYYHPGFQGGKTARKLKAVVAFPGYIHSGKAQLSFPMSKVCGR